MSNKHNKKSPNKQQLLPLFEQSDLEHWEHIRRVEIDGVMHYSILDIFKFYGSTQNYHREWTQVQVMLEKQGFDTSSTDSVQLHQFEGERQRLTPIANLEVFLRIAQVTTFKHWEHIRRFMSQAGAEKIQSKRLRKMQYAIDAIDKMNWPHAEHSEQVAILRERYANIVGHELAFAIVSDICEMPKYGLLNNGIYLAMFRMASKELQAVLGTKEIRDNLGLLQLQLLTAGETALRQWLQGRTSATNDEIMEAIQTIIAPIGTYLRGISSMMGVHHVTGKPLLRSGK